MPHLKSPRVHRRASALCGAFPALRAEGLGAIDVGCRGRVHPILQRVAPLLEVVGFEADRREARRLQTHETERSLFRSVQWLPCALGAADAQAVLHQCRSPGASSFYTPNRIFLDRFPDAERFDVMTSVPVPVRSLDGLMADPAVRMPAHVDFIKIDTQGSELAILQGAVQTLRDHVVAIEVEVEFTRLYAAQPVFREVDAFLSERGFTLFKLRRQEWVRRRYAPRAHLTAGQLVFGDALYVRDPLNGSEPWAPRDARQAEALILLVTLYDLHDFALELLELPSFSLLPTLNVDRITRYITARSNRLNSWSDWLRAVRASLGLNEHFRRHPRRWARGDSNLYDER